MSENTPLTSNHSEMTEHPSSPITMKRHLYYGPFVHSVSISKKLDICDKGAIGVDNDGKIAFVERNVECVEEVLERHPLWRTDGVVKAPKGCFFFPGFIDTHIHASQFPIAGIFGSKTLLEWLTGYVYPMEASYKDINRAKTVYEREVTRTLAQGTTTASYYTTIHVCATNILSDTCLAKGQRAFIGRMCMDFEVPEDVRDKSVKQAIADTQSTINHIKKIDPEYSLIKPIITPRFAVSCSSKMMYELGALAIKEKLPIQTHISESQGEVDRVRVLFPYSESYAQVYESHNILRKGTILGHGVHLSNEEVKLIKKLDGKLSHCPVSNSCLGSGIARVKDWLRAQVDVGLGTDVSGGCAIGILEVARHALQVSRLLAERENDRESLKLQVDEVLSLGTLGGAKVVGLEDRIGNFVVGKEWDALLVQEHKDLFDFQTKWEDKLAKWVYCGDEQNNLKVWVRGRLVFERK